MIRSVLMVCEGNICRSPLAAAMLAHAVPTLDVTSAGTHARVGEGAHALVAEMARARGIALDAHVARQIDAPLISSVDLILTMTRAQREQIEAVCPSARGKVLRLCDEEDIDVVDPYRRHRTVFDLAFAQIGQGVSRWSRTLQEQQ